MLDRASAEVRTQVRKKVRTETGRCNRGCNGLGPVNSAAVNAPVTSQTLVDSGEVATLVATETAVRKAEVRKEVRT